MAIGITPFLRSVIAAESREGPRGGALLFPLRGGGPGLGAALANQLGCRSPGGERVGLFGRSRLDLVRQRLTKLLAHTFQHGRPENSSEPRRRVERYDEERCALGRRANLNPSVTGQTPRGPASAELCAPTL